MNNSAPPAVDIISPDFLLSISATLRGGGKVDVGLPLQGRLHVDRLLPFLCVYRRPDGEADAGTEVLVAGESSYVLLSGASAAASSNRALLRYLAARITETHGAFLLFEVWASTNRAAGAEGPDSDPGFTIVTSSNKPPTQMIESFERSLKAIRVAKRQATVTVHYVDDYRPGRRDSLLTPSDAEDFNCFEVGLEVVPIYRDSLTGDVYPILLRILHRRLIRSMRRGFFEFSRTLTTYRPANSLSFGTRTLVRPVLDVDRQLAEIADSFDLLVLVTPINVEAAWSRFKQSNFDAKPTFYYRPRPIDPANIKKRLYRIILERVDDPTLAHIFRVKRREIERQATMLEERDSYRFYCGGLQLYGPLRPELIRLAREIVDNLPSPGRESDTTTVDAVEFARRARAEIDYYQSVYPKAAGKVEIRADTVGLMVSGDTLLVGREFRVPESRAEALLHHEVGTHMLTWFNGRAQPFRQLYVGLRGYEELQEGLAVLSEYLVGGLSAARLRLLAARVVAAQSLIEGATFVDTFRYLHSEKGFEARTAFTIATRIYRGGGFIKDAIYFRGLLYVMEYLKKGGSIEPLFTGKIAAEHVSLVRELNHREILRPVPLRPRYLDHPLARERLLKLKNGLSVMDLVE